MISKVSAGSNELISSTIRFVSATDNPAAGSSSRSTRGSDASAITISSCLW
jgi:hypothetical protein